MERLVSEWREALKSSEERLPKGDGWKTTDELVKLLGVQQNTLWRSIKASVERGTIEVFHGRKYCGSGPKQQIRAVKFYRVKGP